MLSQQIAFVRFGKAGLDHRPVGDHTACGLVIPASAVRTNAGRHVCPSCEARDPGRVELIERILDWLYQAPEFSVGQQALYPGRQFTAWDFDGAEPFVDPSLHGGIVAVEGGELPEPWQVPWPIDVRIILPVESASGERKWTLCRYRGLRPQETRGRVSIALPFPLETLYASPSEGRAMALWFGRAGPGRWVPIHRTLVGWAEGPESFDHSHEYHEEVSNRAMLGIYLAREKMQQWRVYLGLEGQPGLELPTTPTGAAEVFRLRDIPEGRERRQALRHWVTEHWRTSRADPDEETQVRAHLRGVQQFTWNGLRCRVTPSLTDREREQQLRVRRQESRASGRDRRRK